MSDFQLHAILRGVLIPMVVGGLVFVLARLTPTFIRDRLSSSCFVFLSAVDWNAGLAFDR